MSEARCWETGEGGAAQHYLQVTDEHFERAVAEAAQKAAQNAHETARNDAKSFAVNESEIEGSSGNFGDVPAFAGYFTAEKVHLQRPFWANNN